jgi:hypothetical protein
MRNSALPANSARIQTRALSVRPLAAPALPSLQPLNPSTFQPSALRGPIHNGPRITSHRPARRPPAAGIGGGSRVTPEASGSPFTSHTSLLLLTSNSLRAITYATVCNCRFQRTLSLAPATLTRYPRPNSFPCHSYATRGGGGAPQRVRNLLKTNDGLSGTVRISQSNGRIGHLVFHKSPVTSHKSLFGIHQSPVTSHESRVGTHESRVTDHESRESS